MAKEKLKGNLMDRIRQASTVKLTALMDESKIFKERVMVPFKDYPLLNIASGGSLKQGGFGAGVTQLAGPSKHFKSNLALIHVKAYMDYFKDAICLFYDTEFGSTPSYFRNLGIDMSRVVHTPILNLEELKFDIMSQLDNIERGDHVIIMIDSIGNVASKKEVEDALEGKGTADMTRAKQLKSVFRMITPHLAIKDIPLIAINHTYQCGTADVEVLLPDGTTKSIAEVKKGDVVMTEVGPEEVMWTTTHEDAYITDVELDDGQILSFTNGHQFKVRGEWMKVEDLRVGDDIDILAC